MPEPVYWPNQNRSHDSKPFMRWKVGEPATEFEVPHYYRNLRTVRFGLSAGPGVSWYGARPSAKTGAGPGRA